MKNIFLGLFLLLGAGLSVSAQSSQIQSETSLQAQLAQNLDVKNAKVGDQVVLKVANSIKQKGETVVPKGANIIGRVTEVQQKTKDNAGSRLSLVFDRIQGKNLDTPITASIVSITKATGSANVGDAADADVTGGSNSSGGVSRGNSGGNSGGGLLGGIGNTVGNVAGTTTRTVGGVTNTAGQTVGGATRSLGQTVNGIQISQSADLSVGGSTTLSTADKNLKLEKGLTFNLLLSESVNK